MEIGIGSGPEFDAWRSEPSAPFFRPKKNIRYPESVWESVVFDVGGQHQTVRISFDGHTKLFTSNNISSVVCVVEPGPKILCMVSRAKYAFFFGPTTEPAKEGFAQEVVRRAAGGPGLAASCHPCPRVTNPAIVNLVCTLSKESNFCFEYVST